MYKQTHNLDGELSSFVLHLQTNFAFIHCTMLAAYLVRQITFVYGTALSYLCHLSIDGNRNQSHLGQALSNLKKVQPCLSSLKHFIFLRFPLRTHLKKKIPFCLQKADMELCTSHFRLLGNVTQDQYYIFQRHRSSPVFILWYLRRGRLVCISEWHKK
jgi:hypothetical protein